MVIQFQNHRARGRKTGPHDDGSMVDSNVPHGFDCSIRDRASSSASSTSLRMSSERSLDSEDTYSDSETVADVKEFDPQIKVSAFRGIHESYPLIAYRIYRRDHRRTLSLMSTYLKIAFRHRHLHMRTLLRTLQHSMTYLSPACMGTSLSLSPLGIGERRLRPTIALVEPIYLS